MKVAGRKIVRVDLDALETRTQLREGLLDAAGDVEGVGPRELLDDQHDPWAVVDDGVTDQRLEVEDELRDVGQGDLLAECVLDRDVGETLGSDDRRQVLDDDPLGGGVDKSARADEAAVTEPEKPGVEGRCGRHHHIVERDAVRRHLFGEDLDLELLEPLAIDGDVGDAFDAEQAAADRPVRRHRQVHQGHGVRRQADLHDPARCRERLDHERRTGPGG